ncbi:protein FAM110A [Betta splendens]|uniref:Protein FAM110A n=1 Tax=Betta splendens TaxID=158456 RepID=A0A6P7MZK9_BETSP|nr:protein FAM110A [Betta splendens]XP_029011688.1 protein FAM110A [Betta splendens]
MPVETLQPVRQPGRIAVAVAPPRLRLRGPLGPDLYRHSPTAQGRPKQSAVERLEADKAKYVKSQLALSKQQPVRPAELWKPFVNPGTPIQTTRKTPAHGKPKQDGVQLDLEHLSNLISGVTDGAQAGAAVGSDSSRAPKGVGAAPSCPHPPTAGPQHQKEKPQPPPRPDWASPAKVRLKASGTARGEGPGSPGSPGGPGGPAAGTVRRVDVMPQAGPVRTPCRPPLFIRQPLQPTPLLSKFPLRTAISQQRLFQTPLRTVSSPLKPVVASSKPDNTPSSPAGTPDSAPPHPRLPDFPPPSPAITRLSTSSSRKRPSLTRSKSDMSDRFSRAGTELERFFNLCGVDPAELPELTGSSSDIVSLARFRSVSAPGSECAGSGNEDDEDDDEGDAGKSAERVPYGVSVIERNARVIKWLYGLRQAKDSVAKSTNL